MAEEPVKRPYEAFRTVVLYASDADATDDLRHVLTVVNNPPWYPATRVGAPQERWSDAEVDRFIVTVIRRLAGRVEWAGALLGPDEKGS